MKPVTALEVQEIRRSLPALTSDNGAEEPEQADELDDVPKLVTRRGRARRKAAAI